MHSTLLLLCSMSFAVVQFIGAQFNMHFSRPDATSILYLSEWLFSDVQLECENFLGTKSGFGAVQLSPVTEVRSSMDRYEPISYKIAGRSGDERAFQAMVEACNGVGIRVFVEVVLNNMAGGNWNYPDVPYGEADFNAPCNIDDWDDQNQVRNCQVNGLPDLNQALGGVRSAMVGFMNQLISIGVAGFCIHEAKYMWPRDLKEIYAALNDLNTTARFPEGSRPFIYQDVVDLGSGTVKKYEYMDLGFVTEYRFASDLGAVMLKKKPFHHMVYTGTKLGYLPREKAIVFVDTPQLQRYPMLDGNITIVNFKYRRLLKIAYVFLLAHRYGMPRVTSSHEFQSVETDSPVEYDPKSGQCIGKWICEHRWTIVTQMMLFRSRVLDQPVINWVDNGQNQIAFCRGNTGFVAINAEKSLPFRANLFTCLQPGTYCELLSGGASGGRCLGVEVVVMENGRADIHIAASSEEPYLVLLAGEQLV